MYSDFLDAHLDVIRKALSIKMLEIEKGII